MSESGLRIDKWLWAVRLFKTRSIASEACRSGKVKMGDLPVKPSHMVKPGDEIGLWFPPVNRTVKVVELTSNRVSAKLVPGFMLDLTPDSEYEKLRLKKESGFEYRQPGLGRPTKRQRREIELLKQYFDQ